MSLVSDMKRLLKDASVYGASSVLGRAVSLFMAPIMTRIFLPEDYGVIALIQLAVGFFVMLAGMNIASGMSYYYYKNETDEEKRSVLTSGVSVILLFSLVVSLGLYFGAGQFSSLLQLNAEQSAPTIDYTGYLQIAAIWLFFSLFLSGIQSVIFILRKPAMFLKTQIVEMFLQISGIVTLVIWLNSGIGGVFIANAIASGGALLYGLFLIAPVLGRRISLSVLSLVFIYSLPQMPGLLINWAQSQSGRVFINYYSDLGDLGLYSIAFTLGSVISILIMAFRMAYDPYSLSVMQDADAKEKYAKIYDYYFAGFTCLAGGIGAFAKPLLMILTPPIYHDAYPLVVFIVFSGFYMGANNILATGIWISEKTSYTSYAQLVSLIVLLVSSFILIPLYGGLGAAISYLLGALGQSVSYYIFAQRLWPIAYRYWRGHAFAAIILISVMLNNAIMEDVEAILPALAVASVTGFVIVGISWFAGLSTHERQYAMQYLRHFRMKGAKV